MVGLVQSTRYVFALASPPPPAPLPRSGFVQRPKAVGQQSALIPVIHWPLEVAQ